MQRPICVVTRTENRGSKGIRLNHKRLSGAWREVPQLKPKPHQLLLLLPLLAAYRFNLHFWLQARSCRHLSPKGCRQQVTLANNCRQLQGTSLLTGHTACAFSCGNHVWQHAGGNTNPISVYDNDIRSKPICSGCTCPTTISTTVRTCCTLLTSYQLHNSQCPNIQLLCLSNLPTGHPTVHIPTGAVPAGPSTTGVPTGAVPAGPSTTGIPTAAAPAGPSTTGVTNRRSTSRAIYNRRTNHRNTSRAIYNQRTNCSLAHRLSQPIN
ncbi:hypothetical protein F7725_007668 [Dissostichus mawsoni]|uniref:Uncharacterized protein n=1 Tax=Dissostichus mawsoni TaxID=36200 RepID=A0A7J5Y509_DISMA|nr:hypothetical protein F7725_007668 [Dissostichus mawsoni]